MARRSRRPKTLPGSGQTVEPDAVTRSMPERVFQAHVVGALRERGWTSWFQWKRGAHSQKPEAFIDLVEQVSPPPYVELFARRHRLGWDVWGNESANTAVLGAS